MTKPLLDPPCQGWQRDLPGPNDPPTETPDMVFSAPNHLDEVYLEISRRSLDVRGLLMWLGIPPIFLAAWSLPDLIMSVVKADELGAHFFASTLMQIGLIFLCIWWAFIAFRSDFSPPRSEPARFNRMRRKVYVYGFRFVWWNPFTRWYVTTKSYDWDDLRAEAWKQRGATANGGLVINEGVSLAVVKPGTNQVIDRFHLSGSVQTALWAYICTYMQKGPQALKPCDAPMRDANDTYNPITRLAPKVQWPEAMDFESRTAP